jgi:ankyrin repeat protein
VVKLLLEKGAELETKSEYSQTPLLYAASRGHKAVVKLLLEKGAAAGERSCCWRKALSWRPGI